MLMEFILIELWVLEDKDFQLSSALVLNLVMYPVVIGGMTMAIYVMAIHFAFLMCFLTGLIFMVDICLIFKLSTRFRKMAVALTLLAIVLTAFVYLDSAGYTILLSRYRPGETTKCKQNLKEIGCALEMYSADNQGRYPHSIRKIVPRYMKELPRCMGGYTPQAETFYHKYSGLYFGEYCYKVSTVPDNFTIHCVGDNHEKRNYPQYNAMEGLIEK